MSASLFYIGVFVQGLVWSTLIGRRLGVGFCCVAAYPLGLLLWVLQALTLAFLQLPFRDRTVAIAWLCTLAPALLLRRLAGPRLERRERLCLAGSLAALLPVAALLSSYDASVWSTDSRVILAIGRSIAFHGAISARLEAIIVYLNQYAYDGMPEDGQRLCDMALSLVEVSNLVEMYKNPAVLNMVDAERFVAYQ